MKISPISKNLQKAERRLQERLVSYESLMFDVCRNMFFDMRTGKRFHGKFVIPADVFEYIYHVKNGEEIAQHVRLKSGKKQWSCFGNRIKEYVKGIIKATETDDGPVLKAVSLAEIKMRFNFLHNRPAFKYVLFDEKYIS